MDLNDNNKFFKFVWRFNALAIAGTAVICFLLGSFLAIKFYMQETRTRHVTNLINVEGASKVKDDFYLGYPNMIEGTDYMKVPLYQEQSYNAAYYAKSTSGNDVNYLFLDSRTGQSKWLMPTTAQLFISATPLLEKYKARTANASDFENKTVGIVYTVVEKDTNGDSRLSDKDAILVSHSASDGSDYKKIIEGIDRLNAIRQTADDNLVILYEKNKETICDTYKIPSMKRLSRNAISPSKGSE